MLGNQKRQKLIELEVKKKPNSIMDDLMKAIKDVDAKKALLAKSEALLEAGARIDRPIDIAKRIPNYAKFSGDGKTDVESWIFGMEQAIAETGIKTEKIMRALIFPLLRGDAVNVYRKFLEEQGEPTTLNSRVNFKIF
jgi:hypothetical protein